MKITHVVSSVQQAAAGTSYSVIRLAEALAAIKENDVEILSLGPPSVFVRAGVRHFQVQQDLKWAGPLARLGFSAKMKAMILRSPADVIHTHGFWMMPTVYPEHAARRNRVKLIHSPHGMLGEDALRFSRYKKMAFWNLYQQRAVGVVSCFRATAESELCDIRAFGLRQPVAIVPNGIDLPIDETRASPSFFGSTASPYVLSLGRIHPKKGLDRLIAAWAIIAEKFPNWRLRIVGPDERKHASELHRQIASSGLGDCVQIEEPVFGAEKMRLIRDAQVFALSTLHENFGMTVAESLASGTPVISTKGAPWAGLEEYKCGWWINHGAESMAHALSDALSMSETQRREMGARGRAWMQRDFAWEGVAAKMQLCHEWLVHQGQRPDWVVI
jgi:glycosyltransferase involved in cell wall biosynthesis